MEFGRQFSIETKSTAVQIDRSCLVIFIIIYSIQQKLQPVFKQENKKQPSEYNQRRSFYLFIAWFLQSTTFQKVCLECFIETLPGLGESFNKPR